MANNRRPVLVLNEVPSTSEDHLAVARGTRDNLTPIMRQAYPQAYDSRFKKRPALKMPIHELQAGVEAVLDEERVNFLIHEEAKTRPMFEDTGLRLTFERMLPALMQGYKDSTLMHYKAVIDARCMTCVKEANFRSLSGFIRGAEYDVGEPVRLDNLINGDWTPILATDARLATNKQLRLGLTPECEKHGKEDVFQLAVVHELIAFDHYARQGNGKSRTNELRMKAEAVPGSPVLEARLKTSFEYLWKLRGFYSGVRESISDAFAVRIRVATDEELAFSVARIMASLPQRDWYGSIIPINFSRNEFDQFMRQNLGEHTSERCYYNAHIASNTSPETKPLVVKSKGYEEPARSVELHVPYGRETTTLDSNQTSVLFYVSGEYSRANGLLEQSRIGYQERRENQRSETSTAGDWLTTRQLVGISLDPTSVAYNRQMADIRLKEAVARETSRD